MNDNIRADHLPSDMNITYWFDQYQPGARTGFRFMKRVRLETVVERLEKLYGGAIPYYLEDETYLPYPWGYGAWGLF